MATNAESLEDFNGVYDIAKYLRDDNGWDKRYQRGWTPQRRQDVLAASGRTLSRPEWPERVAAGLDADDDRAFWAADCAAQALGIDTFDTHWRRLAADPLNGSGWFRSCGSPTRSGSLASWPWPSRSFRSKRSPPVLP
jgi:hypothetical protein